MYMVAFVTLMVALIGAYAQIYTNQTAKGLAQQSGLVGEMLAWHTTAVGQATTLVTSGSWNIAGCSLTNLVGAGVPGFPFCAAHDGGNFASVSTANIWTPPVCSGTLTTQCVTLLPTGYNPNYTFYSVAFEDSAVAPIHYYVLTYVPPPPSNGDSYGIGLLCLPGYAIGAGTCQPPDPHKQFQLAFESLFKQLRKNLQVSPFNFGTVMLNNGQLTLTTQTLSDHSGNAVPPLIYPVPNPVPATPYVPANSVGIITQVTPCSTC